MGKKILNILDKYYEQSLICIIFSMMVIIIATQVFTRYVLGFTYSWSEELARMCFVWITLLGFSLAAKQRQHLRVVAFITFLPKNIRRIIEIIGVVTTLVIAFALTQKIIYIMQVQIYRGQLTAAMRIPVWIMYLAGPFGFIGMIIRVIQCQLIPLLRNEEIFIKDRKEEIKKEIAKAVPEEGEGV